MKAFLDNTGILQICLLFYYDETNRDREMAFFFIITNQKEKKKYAIKDFQKHHTDTVRAPVSKPVWLYDQDDINWAG